MAVNFLLLMRFLLNGLNQVFNVDDKYYVYHSIVLNASLLVNFFIMFLFMGFA